MTRKTHNLVQGTDEWKRHRAEHFNASETAAVLGISPYMTRNELLNQKHSGIVPEVDAGTQRRFDDGHRFEEMARSWAEATISDELFPVSMSYHVQGLPLAASLDGLTMIGDRAFEHKTINETIREAAKNNEIPEYIRVQIEHQLIVSGADTCLFMASAGDESDKIELWYEGQPEVQQRIIDAWKQFQKDLDTYTPPAIEAEPVGAKMASLPALHVEVEGKVIATNIDQFKSQALAVFDSISTELVTDQDFADAESAVKGCKEVESRLQATKDNVIGQMATVDELIRALDDVFEISRRKRLDLEKLVKQRKEARRSEIQEQAVKALSDHYATINATLADGISLALPVGFRRDVAEAMKGKRTITSLIDSADQALADAKLAVNAEADTIRANLKQFDELAGDYRHLFADLRNLVGKPADDFANTVKLRISEHESAMAAKKDAEAKAAAAEAERKAEAEKQRADDANRSVRREQIRRESGWSDDEPPAPSPVDQPERKTPSAATSEARMIKLGAINELLAPISITAAGLSELGFEPVGREGSAKLYRDSDFPWIVQAINKHLSEALTNFKREAA